ncbi:hypothetical protein F2Q68_00035984 [Brassica cretica]|uniref:Uncharacterized protein n=1 Tax=Brassica cretica TaxID=69181 RepID=A0A8S9H3R8_BRACR|nr:hypothetical protein F2Q68_00035984 [Brassica cretica]
MAKETALAKMAKETALAQIKEETGSYATVLAKMAKETALAQIKEETGSCKTPNSPPKGESDKAPCLCSADTRAREQEQQVRESARSLFSQVPEDAAYAHDGNPIVSVEQSSSKAGQSQALEKQTLQASQQQQPVYPTEFWQNLSTTLGRIQSNTDQMVKLMSDGHGFAPHPSAVGPRDSELSRRKRQVTLSKQTRCRIRTFNCHSKRMDNLGEPRLQRNTRRLTERCGSHISK